MKNFIYTKINLWFYSILFAKIIEYLAVDSLSVIDSVIFNNGVNSFLGYNLNILAYHIFATSTFSIFLVPSIVKLASKSEKYTRRSIYIMTVFSLLSFMGTVSSLANHNSELFRLMNITFFIALFILFLLKKLVEKYLNTFEKNIEVSNYSNKNIIENLNVKDSPKKKDTPINISALADDLNKLGELKSKGLLTEEEFNEQKKKLLKQ